MISDHASMAVRVEFFLFVLSGVTFLANVLTFKASNFSFQT